MEKGHSIIHMGKILIVAAYAVYAAFWLRFIGHALVWWKVSQRLDNRSLARPHLKLKACALTVLDVVLLGRVFIVNPALWIGEWVFHASFLLVVLRHLRFFLDPVPDWVWWLQTPGLIAGYVLPFALLYILVIRLLTKLEKYAAPANLFLLGLVLAISSIGVVMNTLFTPDLVDVKLFIFGIVHFAPAAAPGSVLFLLHFCLVLVLLLFLPTHIFTAPLVMLEARKREQALRLVIHEK